MHKFQGNIGEAAAIFHFTKLGYVVSKPLFENTPYDLIVDFGIIKRVQVKTTSSSRNGSFRVELRTKGGNTSWNGVVKCVTKDQCDLLFIYCEDKSKYLIPVDLIDGKTMITLNDTYEEYKI